MTTAEADTMMPAGPEAPDTLLEQAHARLVAAINAQPPGTEASYLARLVLLLLNELRYSDAALNLIQVAKQAPD